MNKENSKQGADIKYPHDINKTVKLSNLLLEAAKEGNQDLIIQLLEASKLYWRYCADEGCLQRLYNGRWVIDCLQC